MQILKTPFLLFSFAYAAAYGHLVNTANFNIVITTQSADLAGTNEQVNINVVDERNNSIKIQLPDPSGRLFENGNTNQLTYNVPIQTAFGTPTRASICLGNGGTYNGEWKVQTVIINGVTFSFQATIQPGGCSNMINRS